MQKKEKKWWHHLLTIPICLGIDLIVFIIAALIDSSLGKGDAGHPAPAVLIIVLLVFGLITIILTLRALILCIKTLLRKNQNKSPVLEQSSAVSSDQAPAPKKKKPVWRCFIPLMIEIPVASFLVWLCGHNEINSFYNDPEHIGFAVPVATFFLAFIFLIITIALAVVCIIIASKRANRS